MATLALSNDELRGDLGQLLGIGRDPAQWDPVTTADVNRIIRSGRRRFLGAFNWHFLHQDLDISVPAPITDGSVTINQGVVDLVGATWPADVIDYLFVPDSGGVHAIASRVSDTQIVLTDTTVSSAPASEYTIYKTKFSLPADFGGWVGPITIRNTNRHTLSESRNFPEFMVRSLSSMEHARIGEPNLFSLDSTVDSETAIATYKLSLYPLPDKPYVLETKYKIAAGDTLELATTVVVTDPVFSEAYQEAILAAGEVLSFGTRGIHNELYVDALGRAVQADKAMSGVRYGKPRQFNARRSRLGGVQISPVDFGNQN